MPTHILRRLLITPLTLVGVTILVFMLIAASPGGLSGAVRGSPGQDAGASADHEAYLEDRYGLDEPPLVQYGRWLGRVSPLKFGAPDQVDETGDLVRAPREVKPPPLWQWYADSLPQATIQRPAVAPPGESVVDAKAYRAAAAAHARARADFIAARARLEAALARYARDAGLQSAVGSDGRVDAVALAGHKPDTSLAAFDQVHQHGRAALGAYAQAVDSRAAVVQALAAHPFPSDGVTIIPATLSLAWPDLGVSAAKGRRVADLIADALPITLLLNLAAFVVIYLVAIPSGMLAAVRRGTWIDSGLSLLFVALWSVPTVWAGVIALGYLASGTRLGWFPVSGLHDRAADQMSFLPALAQHGFERGYVLDTLWHMVLPVVCLAYGGLAVLARQTRAAILDNLSADFVRTARAKGAPERDVLLRHVFRNSLLPLITMFVAVFPATLSGSVIIERIFSIPGMGSLILDSIYQRDREVLMANTLIIATVNVLALLLADVLYTAADPRVRRA